MFLIPNCPLLRFKGFKDEWQEVELKDVLKERNNKSTRPNQFLIKSVTNKGLVLQTDFFNKQISRNNNIGYKIIFPRRYSF
ncbi:hypothetical protein [Candidatus Phytoplasma luffae]|uniref:hypothetical protein n=1 Tax=Loofah witches'-broom phytoplasma TaxID=35773 RepID=UPI001B3641B2|nr:hypothetical protein [Candidatus Phytoplasma luffae]